MMRVYARYIVLNEDDQVRPIEIKKWVPNPEKPGYLKYAGNRTVVEVFTELKKRLEHDGLLPDEYFCISGDYRRDGDKPFPERHRWIACYPVTGDNEGHYIHVDALVPREKDGEHYLESVPVFLGKTFQGFDFAAKVAAACAKHLGA